MVYATSFTLLLSLCKFIAAFKKSVKHFNNVGVSKVSELEVNHVRNKPKIKIDAINLWALGQT